MINKKRLVKLTQKLIQINSENPGGDEFEIAKFVKKYLEDLGLRPKIYTFAKKRSNVVCTLAESNRKQSLLITPHLDTVPAGKSWNIDPFQGIIRKNKIFGLGATDCKSNLAVSMEVIRSLIEDKIKLGYNLIFAATADEESGSQLGLELLLNRKILQPDVALVLDADDYSIVVAQKGLLHLKIKINGKKAHGAYPWLGINAIDIAMKIIQEIKAYKFSHLKNKYLKGPTVNIGTIKGGDKVNVVADWSEFELDLRFLPGESSKKLIWNIKNIVKANARQFKIELSGVQEPFLIAEKHPLVVHLQKAMQQESVRPRLEGSEGATTISFFQEKNIPSIATGFGKEGVAHMANEYAEISTLYKGAKILERFLKSYRFNVKDQNSNVKNKSKI